jgi:hypothetical protein
MTNDQKEKRPAGGTLGALLDTCLRCAKVNGYEYTGIFGLFSSFIDTIFPDSSFSASAS